jgi:hypothetical protein
MRFSTRETGFQHQDGIWLPLRSRAAPRWR